MVNNMID